MKIEILPSLLAADFGRLADEILRAEASGAEALHLDIMDAHFVPNLSFGPDVVALAKRTAPGFYRNVHLMMSRPDLYLEKFAAAGAETIQVHVEADCNLHVELKRIRELGLKNAIVLNPETPVERLAPYLDEIDEALVMTVHRRVLAEGDVAPGASSGTRHHGRRWRQRRDGGSRREGRRQPVRRRQLSLQTVRHGKSRFMSSVIGLTGLGR